MSEKEELLKLEKHIRKNYKTITEIHNPDVHALIDWSQPTVVVNDVFEEHFPAEDHEKLAVIVVEVMDLDGDTGYYAIKLEFIHNDLDITVSNLYCTDDVMDEGVDIENRSIVTSCIGKYILSNMLKAAKNRPEMTNELKTVCSGCGRSDLQLNIMVNMSQSKTDYLCAVCLSRSRNEEQEDDETKLEELETSIKKTKKMIKRLEKDLPKMKMDEYPPEIEMFAITPMSMYKSFQAMLAEYKVQKMKILTRMDNPSKLKMELKKALKNEDFELAAVLRDKIERMT